MKNKELFKIILAVSLFIIFLVSWIFNNFIFETNYIFIFLIILAIYLIEYIEEIKYKELSIRFGRKQIEELSSEVKELPKQRITKTKTLTGNAVLTTGNEEIDKIYHHVNKGEYILSVIQTSKLLEKLLSTQVKETRNKGLGYLIRIALGEKTINKNEFELLSIFNKLRNSIVHFNNEDKFVPVDITNIIHPVLLLIRKKLI